MRWRIAGGIASVFLWACQPEVQAPEPALALGASSAHAAVLLSVDGERRPVLIAGIRGPDPTLSPEAAEISRSALEEWIANNAVSTQAVGEPDRYQRVPSLVTLPDGADLAGRMVAHGHVMVWPRDAQEVDFERLLSLEQVARDQNAGHWRSGVFAIRDTDPNRLAPFLDSAQIIEGRVIATGQNRDGRIYLNFGLDWRTDLTVSASRDVRNQFEAQGLELEHLEGAVIRARGWMYAENGPMIALAHRAQLEIIDAPSARHIPR